MSLAPNTIYTYALTGSLRDFTIPFEYLARRFVTVTLIGVDRRELILNTDYRFLSKSIVQTTLTWGEGQGYTSIEIRRNTSATERLVDFADGSILRAYELNTAQVQTMHIAEEARNMVAATLGVNDEGMLDARGRRIINLADAVGMSDAVTLQQVQSVVAAATTQANQSATSATSSAASATAATNSATAATNSATAAASSATQSTIDAASSTASKQAAALSATQSALSATASSLSASTANTHLTNTQAFSVEASGYSVTSESSAARAEQVAAALASGSIGFSASAYDMGLIASASTYFNRDLGGLI
jgi:hypothetical protein